MHAILAVGEVTALSCEVRFINYHNATFRVSTEQIFRRERKFGKQNRKMHLDKHGSFGYPSINIL
jgi:hypothetical protein